MSEELIRSLERQVERATAEAAKYRDIGKRARDQLAPVAAERDKLLADLAAITAERDRYRQQAEAAPGALQKENGALKAARLARDHGDAWQRAIGPELADKATVEHVWREIGYQPGEQVPPPEAIREQARAAREAAAFLFQPVGASPTAGS